MAATSTIEWTKATWNPITGCTLVSEGCRHCYAAKLAGTRLKNHPTRKGLARKNAKGEWKFTGEVRFNEEWLTEPLRWKEPRPIFVCAHGDLFHEAVPDEWIDRVFAVMALAPRHTFQVLTKRPERMRTYLTNVDRFSRECRIGDMARWLIEMDRVRPSPEGAVQIRFKLNERREQVAVGLMNWPLPNVWLGTSVEDQATADERIPHLLNTPAALRFVSYEPALGPVDFEVAWHGENALDSECWGDCAWCKKGYPPLHNCQRGDGDWEKGRSGLDWIIAGGESGPNARPAHPDWFRAVRDQCAAAGVAFFFKQWGEWAPTDALDGLTPPDGGPRIRHQHMNHDGPCNARDSNYIVNRVGKKAAGALLDGKEHRAFPAIPAREAA